MLSKSLRINFLNKSVGWKIFSKSLPIFLLCFFSSQAFGQFGDIFGFGKNKVHYKSFDWSVIKTEHFDIYYYKEERQAALDAARIAERSYAYLSEILEYKFKKKIPLLLYASHNDFQQTNAIQSFIGEGTQGVTESLKGRMILPITGSYGQFIHVLTHEMVHAFQFDIMLAAGPADLVRRFNPPLWFIEGMAEYLSVGMDNITRMWMRDAVLNNTLITIPAMTLVFDIRVYRMGQAIWWYVGERYGKEVIGRIFKTGRATGDINRAFKAHTGLDLIELSKRWQEDARIRYLPKNVFLKKPGEVAKPITDPCVDCTNINIVPALSPDGTDLAYVGDKDFTLNVLLRDLEEKNTVHKIVKSGSSQSYESLRYFSTSMNWSPGGRKFSFVAKAGKNDAIYIVDAEKRKVVDKLSFKHLTGMAAPSWSPTGDRMVFTGLQGGISDLYIVNSNGKNLEQLSNNRYAHLHPQWSPDGKKIAFTTDRGPNTDLDNLIFGEYNIAIYDLESGEIDLLTQTGGNHINPIWSKIGDEILFISDMSGIPNIYSIDLETRELYRITNFITGVSGIITESPAITLAPETGRLAFSAFWNAGWSIYTLDEYKKEKIASNIVSYLDSLQEPTNERENTKIESKVVASSNSSRDSTDLDEQVKDEPPVVSKITSAEELHNDNEDEVESKAISVLEPLEDPNDKYREYPLSDSSEFQLSGYHSKLSLDLIVGGGGFASNVGFAGQTVFLFSDMLGDKNLLIQAAIFGNLLESTIIATYFNQSHRLNWALRAFQFRDDFGVFTARNTAQFESQVFRGIGVSASRPFNRFTRLDFGTDLFFVERDVVAFNFVTGQSSSADVSNSIFARFDVSLVRDTAAWGIAAPYSGTRARLTARQNVGDLRYTQLLADYRKYIPISIPRYTIAYRITGSTNFGRDERLFGIGGPFTFRGVDWGELSGTRTVFQNIEFRFPLLPFAPIQYDFMTAVAFYDVANTWGIDRFGQDTSFGFDDTLSSYGFGLRFNLGGLLVLRWDFPIKKEDSAPSTFFSIGIDY